MAFPIFRFTLSNDIEGSLVISEPGGWDDALLKLERNQKYHSLVEFYEQPLTFYGSDSIHNGGLDYIRNIEQTQGVDADIILTVGIDFGSGYEIMFTGLLDLSQLKEIDGYKADIPVVKENFWTKFINRTSTPVDLQSTISLDNRDVDVLITSNVTLISQKLNKQYSSYFRYAIEAGQLQSSGFEFFQIDFDTDTINEIEQSKIMLPRAMTSIPEALIDVNVVDQGDWDFDIKITIGHSRSIDANFSYSTIGNYEVYIQKNSDTPVIFTPLDVTYGSDVVTEWTYNATLTLIPGDTIKIYIEDVLDLSTDRLFIFGIDGFEFSGAFKYGESYINVTAITSYETTQTESLLLHDVAESILTRITDYGLYSDFLGGSLITTETYLSDGCGYPFTLMKGLHLRQYSFAEKPFYMSFDDFWNGCDPIFCLGLEYEQLSPNQQFINKDFETTLFGWEQFTNSSTLQPFQWDTGGFALADGSVSNLANTARIGQALDFPWQSGNYRVRIKAFNNSTGGSAPLASGLVIYASNNSIGDVSTTIISYTGDATWNVGDDEEKIVDFTLSQNWEYLAFGINKQGSNSGYECYIRIDYIELVNYRIRIENREHFYDSSSNSVNLDYVDNIERSYANDLIFKKIEIGYEKWESENISGIDDPQTKHTYSTNFRKVGEEITLYSKFIAASYAIESTRRKSIEKTKDYRLDNDTFIIAIDPDASPIEPELDQYFSSVTNLNNSDSRYNLRITPYWNFTNWLKWFASSFTPLTAADWTFQRGEGNVSVTYDSNGGCLVNYGANPHNEDDDISLANTALTGTTFDIKVIEFEHPLTWTQYKSIRENRNLSIGVSETNTGHESYFILSLEYQITKGKAKFKLLKAGYQTLSTTFDSTVSTFDSTVLTFDQE